MKFSDIGFWVYGDDYDEENIAAFSYAPQQLRKPLPLWESATKRLALACLIIVVLAALIAINVSVSVGFWIGSIAWTVGVVAGFGFLLFWAHNTNARYVSFSDVDPYPRVFFMPRFWLRVRQHIYFIGILPTMGACLIMVGSLLNLQGLLTIGYPMASFIFLVLAAGPFISLRIIGWSRASAFVQINDIPGQTHAMFTLIPQSIREQQDEFLREWQIRWAEAKARGEASTPPRDNDIAP